MSTNVLTIARFASYAEQALTEIGTPNNPKDYTKLKKSCLKLFDEIQEYIKTHHPEFNEAHRNSNPLALVIESCRQGFALIISLIENNFEASSTKYLASESIVDTVTMQIKSLQKAINQSLDPIRLVMITFTTPEELNQKIEAEVLIFYLNEIISLIELSITDIDPLSKEAIVSEWTASCNEFNKYLASRIPNQFQAYENKNPEMLLCENIRNYYIVGLLKLSMGTTLTESVKTRLIARKEQASALVSDLKKLKNLPPIQ